MLCVVLQLLETLVKNCPSILPLVGNREFMDPYFVVSVLTSDTSTDLLVSSLSQMRSLLSLAHFASSTCLFLVCVIIDCFFSENNP